MTDRHSSEATLVRRAQDGDTTAFEQLFSAYQGRVYGLCLRMTSEPSRAEDLTQDAFVRAWEKLGSFRGQSGFFTWLYRLAVNTVLADVRARGRWNDRLVGGDDSFVGEPAPRHRSSLHAIALERALATLPPQARLIFVLHDVEGYRHREIAAMTSLAVGTSKAHLHNARRLLRKALNG
jgi:RNA polymerase sigma-70 factor (ECF subfamily)